jgi:hypothetical protein
MFDVEFNEETLGIVICSKFHHCPLMGNSSA